MNIRTLILIGGVIALGVWVARAYGKAASSDQMMLAFDPETGQQYLTPAPETPAETADPQPLTFPVWTAIQDAVSTVTDPIERIVSPTTYWKTARYAIYAPAITQAEQTYGIPQDLLARLLYQESRFNPRAMGQVTKYGQAKGIAQFIDSTAAEMGVDPLNAASAIDGAGRYLRQLYNATGTWQNALASYNFGIGNVKNGLTWPTETQKYVAQITADVPIA